MLLFRALSITGEQLHEVHLLGTELDGAPLSAGDLQSNTKEI